jgi:hypothetical protein
MRYATNSIPLSTCDRPHVLDRWTLIEEVLSVGDSSSYSSSSDSSPVVVGEIILTSLYRVYSEVP